MVEAKKLKLEDAWTKLKSAKTFEEHTGTLVDVFVENLQHKRHIEYEKKANKINVKVDESLKHIDQIIN